MSATEHWSSWPNDPGRAEFTVGVEEEVMLLSPGDWTLAQVVDDVLPDLSPELQARVSAETHRGALELATGVHDSVRALRKELASLRRKLAAELAPLGLSVATAGTHAFTQWYETKVSDGARYQLLYGSMRELARREPTFALHVHIAVASPQRAVTLLNRLRGHVPLLLALSANSPFWQGRDTGMSSTRIPIFDAFPRVGIPRAFTGYDDYVETIDKLIRCGAFPGPTFLWWDVRIQPRFGTVEIRVMDAQSSVWETAALVALIQSLARLDLEEGYESQALLHSQEVMAENRFIAARDGSGALLVDPIHERQVPVRQVVHDALVACRPHARALGCVAELESISQLAWRPGATRQRSSLARGPRGLRGVLQALHRGFDVDESLVASSTVSVRRRALSAVSN